MDGRLVRFLGKFSLEPAVSEKALTEFLSKNASTIPSDYLDFIRYSNGGEGPIGNNYLSLWQVEDIVKMNEEYETDLYAPGYLIFGSDGGGSAFAFDKKDGAIVSFQFIGMLVDDKPILMGKTFAEFLEALCIK